MVSKRIKIISGATLGLGLLGGAFTTGRITGEGGTSGTPLERIQKDATIVAKDCGRIATDDVLNGFDQVLQVGQITPEQLAELNGLQNQVETAQGQCFSDSVGGIITKLSENLPSPEINAELILTARNS